MNSSGLMDMAKCPQPRSDLAVYRFAGELFAAYRCAFVNTIQSTETVGWSMREEDVGVCWYGRVKFLGFFSPSIIPCPSVKPRRPWRAKELPDLVLDAVTLYPDFYTFRVEVVQPSRVDRSAGVLTDDLSCFVGVRAWVSETLVEFEALLLVPARPRGKSGVSLCDWEEA